MNEHRVTQQELIEMPPAIFAHIPATGGKDWCRERGLFSVTGETLRLSAAKCFNLGVHSNFSACFGSQYLADPSKLLQQQQVD